MINTIEENLTGKTLTVIVTCEVRKMAAHPIKVLTIEEIVDKISHKYKNIKLISSPSMPVGNTNGRKMSNIGTWVFEVEREEEEEVEKPKTRRTRKSASTKEPKQTTNASIRGRISKLANKED